MTSFSKVALFLFVGCSLLQLTSHLAGAEEFNIYSKPFLMPFLALYLVFRRAGLPKNIVWLMIGGLILSWGGDVFLIADPTSNFMFILGLLSFLMAHICYLLVNKRAVLNDKKTDLLPTQKVRYGFSILLFGFVMVYILFPVLGSLKIPVALYTTVLVLMTLSALLRYGRTSLVSFGFVFFGAVLFMISDSLLAINKFLEPLGLASFWIMLTYITAQFCIVSGIIMHKKEG